MLLRRWLMMAQQATDNSIEIPAEYKRSFSVYYQRIIWNENILRLEHYSSGYAGPTQAYLMLIGKENKLAQNIYGAFTPDANKPLNGFSKTKCYKLVLTVTNVNKNTATDSTTDILDIAIGKRTKYYRTSINIKDIKVGTKIVAEMTAPTDFEGVVFGSTVGSALWSFDFNYKLVEA